MYTKPTLVLDENKCKANIHKMAAKAAINEVEFRPHFKTHQSLEIGSWFREVGVTKITVSSVDMALYFAQDAWQDITIAFPVNLLEITQINQLAEQVNLTLLLEDSDTAKRLDSMLSASVNAFIKINIGNNRAGLEPNDTATIEAVAKTISDCENIHFKGFLGHAGNSYACRSTEEILEIHRKSIQYLTDLKTRFISTYPDLQLSVGDTPTCATAEDFSMVDEIRPGVFVFFDAIMLEIGCCQPEEIAAVIACPVVAVHPDKKELIIYGGRVHLASDILSTADQKSTYGYLVENNGSTWGSLRKDIYIKKISQEHGVVSGPSAFIESVNVGDIVKIVPAHICTAANMFESYVTTDQKSIPRFRF